MNPIIPRYAVMGNPIAHSLSPFIHEQFALQIHKKIDYQKILVPKESFAVAMIDFFKKEGKGLNITVPFKQEAWRLLPQHTERANKAKAVNTIYKTENNELKGDNTDGVGLLADLEKNNQLELKGKKILVLGAGGAARGILMPLLLRHPIELIISNRTLESAKLIAHEFSAYGPICTMDWMAIEGTFDLIINTTSAASFEAFQFLNKAHCKPSTHGYDLVYSSKVTPFLKRLEELGVKKLINGLGMLVEQAAESFYIWHGIRPTTKSVLEQLEILKDE